MADTLMRRAYFHWQGSKKQLIAASAERKNNWHATG
jgi:hypothetical protein